MYVSRLALTDFRSYAAADLTLGPGVTVFVGSNGQGKTNLVEAVDYIARQSSHRVASDQALVRRGADQALVRVAVCRDDRQALLEIELNPGRSNRARVNRGAVSRPRDALGVLRTVLFEPGDLALVKGDPAERRRFLDELLVLRQPRYAGVRADYERALRQRNRLLKTAGGRGARQRDGVLATLEVWDAHLAKSGCELVAARVALVDALRPHISRDYAAVAAGVPSGPDATVATAAYQPSWELPETSADGGLDHAELVASMLAAVEARRDDELDRGVTLVGPHRDELQLDVSGLPARGYASHGESWSLALALRLASLDLLRADGDDPVLILDDVFAELDESRRDRLSKLVAGTEQVLVTAAVPGDVPTGFADRWFDVCDGTVTAREAPDD